MVLAVATTASAAPEDISRPIAEVRLANGKVLKNVELKSYSGDPVSARWDGGAGTIPRKDLPAAVRALLPAVKRSTTESNGRPLLTEETGSARTLKGQVFIATRGGENAKLGAVEICAYSLPDYNAQVKWLQLGALAKIAVALKQADNLDKTGEPARALEIRDTMAVERRKAFGTLARPGANGTKTDADGRFTLVHKIVGPYVVCASAQRIVGNETEYYRWVVPSEEIPDPSNVLLYDANETGFVK